MASKHCWHWSHRFCCWEKMKTRRNISVWFIVKKIRIWLTGSNIDESKNKAYELLLMFCTHWLLIILICCFGILRQDFEQSSNTVLVITSLSAPSVLWFNFNPNRRRRRRASMQDDNRLRITAMMRLTISMFELRGLWFLDDLLRSL